VAVEVAGAPRLPVVRVYLDREGGIDIDTVAEANTWMSAALDELGEPTEPFTLEVSSPGIERPLRKPADFRRFIGSRVEAKTSRPIDGRKQFTGTISEAGDDAFTLDVDGTMFRLEYDSLSRARLRVDIDFRDEGSGSKR
jgi:ribosome maturation factor RimP